MNNYIGITREGMSVKETGKDRFEAARKLRERGYIIIKLIEL